MRTKGKDERGVEYVSGTAVAGRRFDNLEALRAHLAWWQREVADKRLHGTTGERRWRGSSARRSVCGGSGYLAFVRAVDAEEIFVSP